MKIVKVQIYKKKVFDLVKLESKVTNEYLTLLENNVNKVVEKDFIAKGGDFENERTYYANRILRLKERDEYLKRNKDMTENLNKEVEPKKETPTEYVQSLSETEMPSYMDPED